MNAITSVAPGRELVVREVDGAPRILDLDLAERLGFANPIDIRKLVRRHKAALAALGTVATMATVKRGQKAGEFYLNRRQAIFVTAKSETVAATEITVEIVRKFDAYERGTQPASSAPTFNVNLNDPDHLLTLSSELAHALKERNVTVQALRADVATLTPKAAAWSRIADTSGVITITNFAKTAGIGPKWLAREYLTTEARWCYRRRESHSDRIGPLIAYQEIVDRGWMVHKLAEFMRSDGSVGTRDQVYLTPAGAAKLAEMLVEYREKAA